MYKIVVIEEGYESKEQDRELYSQRVESIDLPAIMEVVNKKKRVRKMKKGDEK